MKRAIIAGALRLPPSWVAAALRPTLPQARRIRPVAAFERDDGRLLTLLDGYREHGKARWRKSWWSTRALLVLRDRGQLPEEAHDLVGALAAARTLPAPVVAFAERAAAVAAERPDLLRPTGRTDVRLGRSVLAAVPRDEDIGATAAPYVVVARAVVAAFESLGVDLPAARILEAGCGAGYGIAAVAAAGAGEAVGIDRDVAGETLPEERDAVRCAIAGRRPLQLDEGDVRSLPYPDAAFDAVFSLAVFEHVEDLPRALVELRRVTRPRGFGYHGIDTWFGPAGGHGLLTLDAPWGHVRLEERELERYLRELRPHEADDAIEFYRHAFQTPRLSMAEMATAARAAGFDVLSASLMRLPLYDPHRAWFSSEVLRDARRASAAVTPADLLSVSATLVLRRA